MSADNLTAKNVSVAPRNDLRGAYYLATLGDFNHAIYNDYSNIDGEGSWDGSKWNCFDGLSVRTGAGASKKTSLHVTQQGMFCENASVAPQNDLRGAYYLATLGDFNHAIYNNYSNIDGEGSWDGSKWNCFDGLNVRVGSGNSKMSALFIDRTGNAGIGTMTPTAKLEVEGTIKANGLDISGSLSLSGQNLSISNLTTPPSGARTIDLVVDEATGRIYRQS